MLLNSMGNFENVEALKLDQKVQVQRRSGGGEREKATVSVACQKMRLLHSYLSFRMRFQI